MAIYDLTSLMQTLKQQTIDDAISAALDAVYEKVSVLDMMQKVISNAMNQR